MATEYDVTDDTALLARIRDGDRQAFATLVHRHTQRFYALAYRTLFNREAAEDIVQEVFLKVWDKPHLWQPDKGAAFTTWFYRVVLNMCHTHRREYRPLPLAEGFEPVDTGPHADETLAARRRDTETELAILSLPHRQRDALNLCYFEGLSNREAAEIMGVRIKALESLLMRAKTTLRDRLKDYTGETYYDIA